MRRRLPLIIAFIISIFTSTVLLPAPEASAVSSTYCSTITRCMNTSYYSGWRPVSGVGVLPLDNHYNYWDSTAWDYAAAWSFPSACTNQAARDAAGNSGRFPLPACAKDPGYVNVFLATISGYIFNPNYVCQEPLAPLGAPLPPCAYDQRQALGAAMIVNTMMKVDPLTTYTDPRIQGRAIQGVSTARNLFASWSALVRQYDAQGLVDWNFATVEQPNHINSTWAPLNMRGYQWGQDDVFFSNPSIYPVAEIKFSDASGRAFYEINRRCGNINGAVNPFPSFSVSGILQSGPSTPPGGTVASPGGPVQSGSSYDIRPGAWNAGPGQASAQTYTLHVPANVTPTSFGGGAWDAANRTVTWTGVALPRTGVGSAVFKDLGFTVNAGTYNGTLLTFDLTVGPHDPSGANAPPVSLTYEVQIPRYPSFTGDNGDIHAGGGICSLASSSGRLQADPKAASGGQYVISSSGLLGDVASGGSNKLTLGGNGGYARSCRPDLLARADSYVSSGGATSPLPCPAGTDGEASAHAACSTMSLSSAGPGVYLYDGAAPLTVHGIVRNKITIVSRHAPVIIDQVIVLDSGVHPARQVPSLGIISAGDIRIPASVTRVDAYLYSGAAIDTCLEASSACATPALTINGFIMGKSLRLNRLGLINSQGSQPAEHIVLNPQLYLNPPTLFDAAAVEGVPVGIGEQPPLF